MALIRKGQPYAYGTSGEGGDVNIISRTTQRRYGSEVEIVKGDGEVHDVIYSGDEEVITETTIQESTTFPSDNIGDGDLDTDGVTTRISIQLSNEDLVRVEKEKLKINLI